MVPDNVSEYYDVFTLYDNDHVIPGQWSLAFSEYTVIQFGSKVIFVKYVTVILFCYIDHCTYVIPGQWSLGLLNILLFSLVQR